MQKFVINTQHFKTITHLIICLLNFHRATPTPHWPTHAHTAVGAGCQIPPDIQDISVIQHPLHNLISPGSWVKDLESIHVWCKNRNGISGAATLFCYNGKFDSNFPSCSTPPTPTTEWSTTEGPTPAQTPDSGRCQIPSDIQGISVTVDPFNITLSPGSWVENLETIHVECNNRAAISGAASLFCDNGQFNSNFPSCSATPTSTTEGPTPAQTAGSGRCQIPPDIQGVSVMLHYLNIPLSPGSWVEDLETIHVECNNRAASSGAASLFCDNGQFNSNFPSCSATPTSTTEGPTPAETTDYAGCQIPPDIQDVSVKLHPLNTTMSPGSWVEDSDTIHVECNNRVTIPDAASLLCDNGQFNSNFPSCSATTTTTTTTTQLPTPSQTAVGSGCQIPTDIQDVMVILHPLHNLISPGYWVKDLETIHVWCNNRTGISGGASLLCYNGQFNSKFPSCADYCDGNLLKGLSTVYYFREGHYLEQIWGSKKILPNTEIEVICAAGYKRSNVNERQIIRCLSNGMFDVEREKCDLECGLVQPSYMDLRRKRGTVEPNHVPWHVSIYLLNNDEYVLLCTGSVISPSLVISAAHCFWDNLRQSQKPIENYQFIAGKYKRKYSFREDDMPQIREAESIQISQTFRGKINGYDGDVALIKLKEPLIFNDITSAVCMLPKEGAPSDYIESGTLGAITHYAQDNTLKRVSIKARDCHSCSKNVEGLSPDKFCLIVGNDNPICIGDAGGSFVVKKGAINYISGIVSYTTFNVLECDLGGVMTVTNVSYIKPDLIEKIKSQLQEDTLLY